MIGDSPGHFHHHLFHRRVRRLGRIRLHKLPRQLRQEEKGFQRGQREGEGGQGGSLQEETGEEYRQSRETGVVTDLSRVVAALRKLWRSTFSKDHLNPEISDYRTDKMDVNKESF